MFLVFYHPNIMWKEISVKIMFNAILQQCRTPFLLLIGASLLAGCADIKDEMNNIRNSLAEIGKQNNNKTAEADAQSSDQHKSETKKSQKPTLQCPDIKIIEALDTIHKFTEMNPPEESKRISTARLMSLQHECRITDNGKGQVDLFMTFESATGPAIRKTKSQDREISYPYFIAVTDKTGAILSKDVFELTITPSANTGVLTARENIRQIIPVETDQALADYHIAIGFQMSDAQLQYNRKHMGNKTLDKPEKLTPDKPNTSSGDAHKQIHNLRK